MALLLDSAGPGNYEVDFVECHCLSEKETISFTRCEFTNLPMFLLFSW